MKYKIFLVFYSLILCMTACSTAPPIQYYVLEPSASLIPATLGSDLKTTIGIGPVTVPGLLDRSKIITRSTNNSVQIAEFQQWASPIQDNFTETLMRDLTALQPNRIFRAYPWSVYGNVDLQIIIDVLRFDSTPGVSTNLEADWMIKNEASQVVLKTGRTVLRQQLSETTYPGMVKALSEILGAFSHELSIALLKIDSNDKPSYE